MNLVSERWHGPARVRRLSRRDSEALLELLRNPPPPNEALMRAALEHRRLLRGTGRVKMDE